MRRWLKLSASLRIESTKNSGAPKVIVVAPAGASGTGVATTTWPADAVGCEASWAAC